MGTSTVCSQCSLHVLSIFIQLIIDDDILQYTLLLCELLLYSPTSICIELLFVSVCTG